MRKQKNSVTITSTSERTNSRIRALCQIHTRTHSEMWKSGNIDAHTLVKSPGDSVAFLVGTQISLCPPLRRVSIFYAQKAERCKEFFSSLLEQRV